MNFTGRDLVKLRLPLIGTLLTFAFVCALGWWSAGKAGKAVQERDRTAAQRLQSEQRLRQARTEEQDLKTRAAIFQNLQTTGIAGDEKRLEWTETLRSIQHALRIPSLTYEFGAQAPLESLGTDGYGHFASPMRLQAKLLHEEDLLKLLVAIEKQAKALVLVRSCKLTRIIGGPNEATFAPQLGAECDMQWITVRRINGKKQP